MKQVIKNTPKAPTINLEDCNPDKFYGLIYDQSRRAMLTQVKYDTDEYFWICVNAFNKGNYAYQYGVSFKEALDSAIENGEIFEFDTAKELLLWAAESKVK